MSSTLELSFKSYTSYDEKCEIEIKLPKSISSDDYKTIVDAAETILKTANKYITKPEPKADTKEKE